jgi:BarA-like signal transduction histidine kinase
VGNGAVRTALIIIYPPSLNQALRLGQSVELVDIAAQGKNIADDVRAIEARQISKQQCLLHPLQLLQLLQMVETRERHSQEM